MRIIGLTGGIGSGKSTAAKFLAELGAAILDLDRVGHEVIKKGRPAYGKLVGEFGEGILKADGSIDRARLGSLVFRDREALQRLNRIVHPAIDEMVKERVEGLRRRGVKVVVLEAAAMLEAGRAFQMDEIWVTTAPEAAVLDRLKERSGYGEAETRARIDAQMPDEERLRQADVIINTDGTLEEVRARVGEEWRKLLERL